MSDTRYLIEVRITHELRAPSAEAVAELIGKAITEAYADDPKLLATATPLPARWVERSPLRPRLRGTIQ